MKKEAGLTELRASAKHYATGQKRVPARGGQTESLWRKRRGSELSTEPSVHPWGFVTFEWWEIIMSVCWQVVNDGRLLTGGERWGFADRWWTMDVCWQVVNDGRLLTGGEWWAFVDRWWTMGVCWQVVNDGRLLTDGEWWAFVDRWWMMGVCWQVVNDGRLLTGGEWWTFVDRWWSADLWRREMGTQSPSSDSRLPFWSPARLRTSLQQRGWNFYGTSVLV